LDVCDGYRALSREERESEAPVFTAVSGDAWVGGGTAGVAKAFTGTPLRASGGVNKLTMARLGNPKGSQFMVGEQQREWLKNALAKVSNDAPIVVVSHSQLQKIDNGASGGPLGDGQLVHRQPASG
jgi:hypothetical protein